MPLSRLSPSAARLPRQHPVARSALAGVGCRRAGFLLVLALGSLLAVEGSRAAEVTANSRVRAGPDRASQTITVLSKGTMVSVLGRSEDGRWLRIACPDEAYVWVHRRNLLATDDPRVLRVITPGTHVRADSRIQAPVLGRLAEGELVTWVGSERDGLFLGRRVGDWYGVRVDSLPVYVHADLVRWQQTTAVDAAAVATAPAPLASSMPAPAGTRRSSLPVPADQEALWVDCRHRYEAYRQGMLDNPADGLTQPWLQLQVDLQRVVAHHPRVRTRLLAQRLDSRIKRLLRHAELLRARGLPVAGALRQLPPTERRRQVAAFDQGVRSAMSLAAEADERAAATPAADAPATADPVPLATAASPPVEPPTATSAGDDPFSVAAAPPTATAPATSTTGELPASDQQRSAAAVETAPVSDPATPPPAMPVATPAMPTPTPTPTPSTADAPALDGWLIEEQVADLAVHHVLKNQQGELVGLLKMPADSQIQLSDYRWQHVIVHGLPQQVEVDYDGRRQSVRLVTVTDIDKVP